MAYKTCVTIAEKTPKKLNSVLKKALKKSDYAELRFDFLKPSQVPDALELVKKNLKKCVCTLRPTSEGGKFGGNENERISILKLIAEYHPFLIDVEYNTLKRNKNLVKFIKKSKTDILVSWHDFNKTPNSSSLNQLLKQMRKFSKFVKIVTSAKKSDDTSRILSLYSHATNTNLIAFAMGNIGRISRILCLHLASPFTYVTLGKPVAPGQFSLDAIKSIANFRKK